MFVLALALALTGIVAGIALRIRAFLYAGVAFLVLNVIGQLLRFYPEQGLSRALILLGLGATITVGMVVFNLKREAILRRIRIARADLAGWGEPQFGRAMSRPRPRNRLGRSSVMRFPPFMREGRFRVVNNQGVKSDLSNCFFVNITG